VIEFRMKSVEAIRIREEANQLDTSINGSGAF
jgi:hypothetical protein